MIDKKEFNLFDYMLKLRDNKILFYYLKTCAVNLDDDKGYIITGESKEGHFECYQLSNGIVRITLPIQLPFFFDNRLTSEVLVDLQPTLEGIITVSNNHNGSLYFEYSIHVDVNDDSTLDKALLTFIVEKEEIEQGLVVMTKDFAAMGKKIEANKQAGQIIEDGENLNSLWDTIKEIEDSVEDEEE